MLASTIRAKDYAKARELGVQMPEKDVIYTVSWGPGLMYCYIHKRSTMSIQIEELGGAYYDPEFFIEVQEPMRVDLGALLNV